jgi:hypothetical protein
MVYTTVRGVQQDLIGTSANPHSYRHMQVVVVVVCVCVCVWTGVCVWGGGGCAGLLRVWCVCRRLSQCDVWGHLLAFPVTPSTGPSARDSRAWYCTRAGVVRGTHSHV